MGVSDVPVEGVQLGGGETLNNPPDRLEGHEVPGRIKENSSPGVLGSISDSDTGGHVAVFSLALDQLRERLQTVSSSLQ